MNKTLKKTLSIILTILMIITSVPFAFAAGDGTPLTIDLSVVTASYISIGNGYDYYDEDGYIITGTNTNVKIYIYDSCDITFSNMSANGVYMWSQTASNVTVTLDGDNYMEGYFDVCRSHLTINGDDDDTLNIEIIYTAFSTGVSSGTLTVNGGKINAVTETTGAYPTIYCSGGFILNGGEVTASNNYFYVIANETVINGGTLNVISTSPDWEAIIGDVEIAKGALLTASATYKVIHSDYNITPVNEAEENLSLFARFDTDTDFAPVYDIKAALEDKTYAEIKVDTHEHSLDNTGKCVCGYACPHESITDGTCGDCGYVCLHENYTDGVCDVCGESCEHSGGTATCVGGKICELCKTEYGEVDADAHDWSNKDGVCANACGFECPHENYADGKCDDCGYVNVDYTEIDEYIKSLEKKLDNERIWDGSYKAALDICKSAVEEMKDNVNTTANDLAAIENKLKYLEAVLDDFLNEIAEAMAEYDRLIEETGKYTEENVKSSDIEAYEQLIKDIDNIRLECLTENEIAALDEAIRKLDNLYRVIENVQDAIRTCQGWLDSQSEETIRPNNKVDLQTIRDLIQSLIDGDNITDEERATINEMLEKVEALEKRIAEENCANGVHVWGDYYSNHDATCMSDGTKSRMCSYYCGAIDTVTDEGTKLDHTDEDGDYICDYDCGHEFEKPADNCDHLCHKTGFVGFIWKIVQFFWKLFRMNPVCECGVAHY